MLVCVAVIAGVVWYRVGVGGADDAPPRRAPAATSARLPAAADVQPPTTKVARDVIVVHVAGAVTRPGVVDLDAGARVIDAVEAAGGAVPEADLDRLNLAAKVADGERILVSRVGDPPADDDGSASGSAGSRAPMAEAAGERADQPQHRDARASSTPSPASGRCSPRRSSTSESGARSLPLRTGAA